jgi:hypothetical protein
MNNKCLQQPVNSLQVELFLSKLESLVIERMETEILLRVVAGRK